MHGRAVVPHEDVADAPLMAVDVFVLGCRGVQDIEHRFAFFRGHVFQADGEMRIDEQRSAAGFGVGADNRVGARRFYFVGVDASRV